MDCSPRTREPAVQRSPLLEKIMNTAASSARDRSASSNTTKGLLPPNSMENFLRPDAFTMRFPVAVEPVKEIARTSGCRHKGSPASAPNPCTMLRTPAGIPASNANSPKRAADSGDSSLILSTAVLPKASAGATFQVEVMNGTFQGEINAHTPTGWNKV